MINICGLKHLEYILIVIRILQMMNCKALIKKQNVRAPDFHSPLYHFGSEQLLSSLFQAAKHC